MISTKSWSEGMGGYGSGSWQTGKKTTSNCLYIDVRHLQRQGLLSADCGFSLAWKRRGKKANSIGIKSQNGQLILTYQQQTLSGDSVDREYHIRLSYTACTLGGHRYWFLCPASGCGRRVAILYLGDSGIFACRHCNLLAYKSQRENRLIRTIRRADKIRCRLGWIPGILNDPGGRPKGMHQQTFIRLYSDYDSIAQVAFGEISVRLGILKNVIDNIKIKSAIQ
jgi:hypothetical protein